MLLDTYNWQTQFGTAKFEIEKKLSVYLVYWSILSKLHYLPSSSPIPLLILSFQKKMSMYVAKFLLVQPKFADLPYLWASMTPEKIKIIQFGK